MPAVIPTRPNACCVCGSSDHSVVAQGTDFQYGTTEQQFNWVRCDACGHHYIDPIPTVAALPLIYPNTIKNYADFDINPGLAFRVKALLDGRRLHALAKDIRPGGRLLDVGCAAGMLLDTAKKSCPNLSTLEGLEISKAAAAGAVRKGYKVYISTIEKAELPQDFYDLIVMQQVIEHVHDPRAVLAKLFASLRKGGRLVMDTPHLGSWDQAVFRGGYWEGYHIPRHFNIWIPAGMENMARDAGFADFQHRLRIKPVHWTVSLQNWAVATRQPKPVIRFFDLRNPLLLLMFGMIDLAQLGVGKASDVQYIVTK